MLAFANRVLAWSEPTIQSGLIVVALVSCAALLAVGLLRGRRAVAGLVAAVVGFTLRLEPAHRDLRGRTASDGLSDRLASNFVQPRDWVDRATGGGTVTIVGQQFVDPTGIWLTEFFNRSVKQVWSVDPTSTAPGPGRP